MDKIDELIETLVGATQLNMYSSTVTDDDLFIVKKNLRAEYDKLRKALVFVRSCLDENNDDAIDRIDAALRGEQ